MRHSATTWLKFEHGNSTGTGATAFGSNDGGFNFTPTTATNAPVPPVVDDGGRGANRIDGSIDLNDVHKGRNGQVTLLSQTVEGGYAAPGVMALTDVNAARAHRLKTADHRQGGPAGQAGQAVAGAVARHLGARVDADYQLDDHWKLSSGVRKDSRTDNSPLVPLTQVQGDRTDVVARVGYDSQGNWAAYGYVQDTASITGNREQNGRIGAGGAYRFNDRLKMAANSRTAIWESAHGSGPSTWSPKRPPPTSTTRWRTSARTTASSPTRAT